MSAQSSGPPPDFSAPPPDFSGPPPGFPGPPPYLVDGVLTIALAPPGWGKPNFENPMQQLRLEHFLIFGIGGTISTIAMVQRLYTKLVMSKGLEVDDGFMIVAWALAITMQGLMTYEVIVKVLGVHSWEITVEHFMATTLITYVASGLYMVCSGCAKLSLLSFYLQLSPARWFRLAVWTSLILVGTFTIVITTLLFVHCLPIRASWDITTPGQCIRIDILYIVTAWQNIITDIIIFMLPIPMLVGLQMRLRHKILAMSIFAVGTLTIATSSIRLKYLQILQNSKDIPWDAAAANIWIFIEGNLFVLCGSTPTLRQFFKHFSPRHWGTTHGGRSASAGYGQTRYTNTCSNSALRTRSRHTHTNTTGTDHSSTGGRYYNSSRFCLEDYDMTDIEAPPPPPPHHVHPCVVGLGIGPGGKYPRASADVVVTAVESRRGSNEARDDASEKAILTTKTVEVNYE